MKSLLKEQHNRLFMAESKTENKENKELTFLEKLYKTAQCIRIGKSRYYVVCKYDGIFDMGTWLVTVTQDGEHFSHKQLSSAPIKFIEKIVHKDMRFMRVELQTTHDKTTNVLFNLATFAERNDPSRDSIIVKKREDFQDVAHSIMVRNVPYLPLTQQASIDPGYDEDLSNYLILGRDAVSPKAQPWLAVVDKKIDTSEQQQALTELLNNFPTARKIFAAMVAGFLVKPCRLQENPIYNFYEPLGNTGKSTITSMLMWTFADIGKVRAAKSTAVGIERRCYSANDSFYAIDELQKLGKGNKHQIADFLLSTGNGGNRDKASGSGADTDSNDFTLSMLTLANDSIENMIRGVEQFGPITSRTLDIEIERFDHLPVEQQNENEAKLDRIKETLQKNKGFMTTVITDWLIANRDAVVKAYNQVKLNVKKQLVNSSSNGREVPVISIYQTADLLISQIFNLAPNQNLFIDIIKKQQTDESHQLDKYYAILTNAFHKVRPHLEVQGCYADEAWQLVDTEETEDRKAKSAWDKQVENADKFNKNIRGSILGRVKYTSLAKKESLTNFDDAEMFAITTAGYDEIIKADCEFSQAYEFFKGIDCIDNKKQDGSLINGKFAKKIKGIGKTMAFDLKKIREKVEESETAQESETY